MQTFLGFGTSITYCALCNIKYNKASPKDVSFHNRMHKRPRIPRSIQICENFYNKRTRYYYGKQWIRGCCDGSISQNTYVVTYLYYETTEAKDMLLTRRGMVYKHIEFSMEK